MGTDGRGNFVLVSGTAISAVTLNSEAVVFGDVNADGRADILIANGPTAVGLAAGSTAGAGTANELHLNQGGGQYGLVAGTSLTADGSNTQTIEWGEYATAIRTQDLVAAAARRH